MVICGPVSKMPARPSGITNPVLIAEVLSPGTEAYDRGEKARLYRASPTVTEGVCEFSSLDCRIPLSDLYEGVLDA